MADGKEERKLIETIWKLLLHGKDKQIKKKIINFIESNSMTLSKGVLNVFTRIDCPERRYISQVFFKKWKDNQVVLDSWFFFKASIEIDDNQKNIDDFKKQVFRYKNQYLEYLMLT